MSPSRVRNKLRSELLHSDLIRHSARYMYDERKRAYIKLYEEQNNKSPSKDELIAFYEIAREDLKKELDEILDSFLDVLVRESDSWYFIKNITLFGIVTTSFGMSLFIATLACIKSLFPEIEINYSIGLQEYISVLISIGLLITIAIHKASNFIKKSI